MCRSFVLHCDYIVASPRVHSYFNLIRTIMAQAATMHSIEPRTISFKGAIQTLEAFQPAIAIQGQQDSVARMSLYQHLLNAIATHRVADRPDRFEPRMRKTRPKNYLYLRRPRAEIKLQMTQRVR